LDLYGIDASQKAIILSRAAFGRNPDSIDVTGIQCLDETKIREAYVASKNTILVVNCTLENNIIKVQIEPVAIDKNHSLAQVTGTQNAVLIQTQHNETIELYGTGVGRWPVAESVFADLLELSNQLNRNQLHMQKIDHNSFVESEITNKSLEEVV
jgi:homoserine dehydrogenase